MTDDKASPDAIAALDGEKKSGAPNNAFVMKLRKPVMAHGDEVSELTFREPTAADIEICGSPVTYNAVAEEGQKRTQLDHKAMFAMMSRLATVPPSTIRQMNSIDWEYAANVLAYRFFTFEN
jgi:hypothetical protein